MPTGAPDLPLAVTARIEEIARRFPDRVATVTQHGQEVSYEKLAGAVAAFASRLHGASLRGGEVVAVMIDDAVVRLCLALAVMRTGATFCIPRRIDLAVQAGVAIDHLVTLEPRETEAFAVHVFSQDWFATPVLELPPPEAAPVIASSSGSTGLPKYMMLPAEALERRALRHGEVSDIPAEGCCLIGVNLGATYGFARALSVWMRGHCLLIDPGMAADAMALLARHPVTGIIATPARIEAYMKALADTGTGGAAKTVQVVELGGAAVSRDFLERVSRSFDCRVAIAYGTTETGSVASGCPLGLDFEPGLTGRPYAGAEIAVIGEDGRPLPAGMQGEICLRVPKSDRIGFYYNSGTAYDAEGWFHTGDLGLLRADGALVLKGRCKDILNLGGSKLSPATFEAAALELVGVRQAAAFGVPGVSGFDDIWIALVGAGLPRSFELRAALEGRFHDRYRINVIQLPALPMNDGGKIDRVALERLARREAGRETDPLTD